MTTWVIKLGGSLYDYDGLDNWLQQLQHLSSQYRIIVVPGGGPFADQVRQAQQQLSCSDRTAHHMALLAMAQFGLLIADKLKYPELYYYPPSDTIKSTGLAVWIPDKNLLDIPQLKQNWSVTSDTLALWLAQQINADALHLVKRIHVDQNDIKQLYSDGIVDAEFPVLYGQKKVLTHLYWAENSTAYPEKGLRLR